MEKEIYKKLFKLQQEFKSKKDNYNQFGKYNFRNVEAMLTELKPLLSSLDLVIVFTEELINDNYLKSICKLIDVENGEEFETHSICAIDKEVKGMSNSQATGCALTYSRKYTLQALLAIDDGKSDPDLMNRDDFKKKTTEEKVNDIITEIDSCSTIEELTALWKKIGNWSKNELIKNCFTSKKKIINKN